MLSKALTRALAESRDRKFLGPGPLQTHITNAEAFASLVPLAARTVVDLGSGGGVPALIMAEILPAAHFTLIERGTGRAQYLHETVLALGMADRVWVICDNAETASRDPLLEGAADVVTARSFGPPATTAECACRFLKPRGLLVVSEPPDASAPTPRWPHQGLTRTGLVPTARTSSNGGTFQILTLTGRLDPAIPRTPAATRKRALF